MVDKEMIGIWRNMLKPAISSWLLKTNKAQLSREGTTKDTTFSCSHENDTISRQAAIDAHCELCPDRHICCPIHNGNICPDIEVFGLLPSAQPKRKTATWLIRKWGDDAKCSNCGRYFKDVYDMDNYDQYCRHCGTQMKGIEQHE